MKTSKLFIFILLIPQFFLIAQDYWETKQPDNLRDKLAIKITEHWANNQYFSSSNSFNENGDKKIMKRLESDSCFYFVESLYYRTSLIERNNPWKEKFNLYKGIVPFISPNHNCYFIVTEEYQVYFLRGFDLNGFDTFYSKEVYKKLKTIKDARDFLYFYISYCPNEISSYYKNYKIMDENLYDTNYAKPVIEKSSNDFLAKFYVIGHELDIYFCELKLTYRGIELLKYEKVN